MNWLDFVFRKPCGSFESLCNHHETWFSSRGKRKRECTVVKRGSVFTQGTLPWNLQALFCCQSTTCILAQDRTNLNKMCICGCLSFLGVREALAPDMLGACQQGVRRVRT